MAAVTRKQTNKPKIICGHSKKVGHTTDECWHNPNGRNFKPDKPKRNNKINQKPRLAVAVGTRDPNTKHAA